MASTERTLRSMLTDQFTRRVSSTADQLRAIADEIEREARGIDKVPEGMFPGTGTTSAAAIAASIVHRVMWGLANANVDSVVSTAAEFDILMSREGSDG